MLYALASVVERKSQRFLGKGWTSSPADEVRQALSLILPPKVVVDGGGNVGNWSAALLTLTQPERLIIVEPAQKNLENLAIRFGAAENVVLFDKALSGGDGDALLYSDFVGSGLASLHQRDLRHVGKTLSLASPVRTATLGSMMREVNIATIDLLKLDVEGHEFAILNGAQELFAQVGAIQFEFGGTHIDSRVFFRDFWYLLSASFDIYRMSPWGPLRVPTYSQRDESFLASNFLCVRRRR